MSHNLAFIIIISFISGNLAHRTQKKIDRENRTNIKHRHTHTHKNAEKKEKQIVEFSMLLPISVVKRSYFYVIFTVMVSQSKLSL